MARIVLIGMRGAGKSSVGRRLAGALSVPFLDTDRMIEEQEGIPIPEIFARYGEAGFRQRERDVIAGLGSEDAVVATGGGVVLDPGNVLSLRRESIVIYLHAPVPVLAARVAGSDRPSLTGAPPAEELAHLLEQRAPLYRAAADYCIDSGTADPSGTAAMIRDVIAGGTASAPSAAAFSRFLRETGFPDEADRVAGPAAMPRLCAIAGHPCRHSKSPALHNALFARYDVDYRYLMLESPDIGAIIGHVRAMDFKGLSVTIPHKETIIPFLDELDEDAAAIGAVNTVVQCGGMLYGSNTDWIGVRDPLRDAEGRRAVVLGAGGAAAAAVYALLDLDFSVTVLNRTPDRSTALADRFGCLAGGLDDFDRLRPDIVVNATPVGMERVGGSLLSPGQLRPGMTVFDLVYTPRITPLLRHAGAAGARVISGEEMFISQACEQFRRFTGIRITGALAKELLP